MTAPTDGGVEGNNGQDYIETEDMRPGLALPNDEPAGDVLQRAAATVYYSDDPVTELLRRAGAVEAPQRATTPTPPRDDLKPDFLKPRRRRPPHPDATRQTITFGLLILLALIVAAYVVLPATGVFTVDESGQVFDRVFTPILALAGTATGFYFGDPDHRNRRRDNSDDPPTTGEF